MRSRSAANFRSLLAELRSTWTGRIILVNFAVFLGASWHSQSILFPEPSTLWLFGAKDPVGLAQGQSWRLLSAIFLHIGIVHFVFNAIALFRLGNLIEGIAGSVWFLITYFVSGFCGNELSAITNLATSAGASSSIFGLVGFGLVIEQLVIRSRTQMGESRRRRNEFINLAAINIVLGLLIPGIDNAAHIGGLVSGAFVALVMGYWQGNAFLQRRRPAAIGIGIVLVIYSLLAGFTAVDPAWTMVRFSNAIADSGSSNEKLYYLGRGLEIVPSDVNFRIERAKILILEGKFDRAFEDLQASSEIDRRFTDERIQIFKMQLIEAGRVHEADMLEQFQNRK